MYICRSGAVSTCSDEATWYGSNQKVISFTLFHGTDPDDDFKDFIEGIYPNLNQIRTLYSDWVVRIYTNLDLDQKYCKVACLDKVFWCDIRQSIIPNLSECY